MGRQLGPILDWRARLIVGCVCGGVLKADLTFPDEVERVVRRHRLTYRHVDWWARAKATWY